jgi:Flp pilus assembly protein TadB
LLAGVWAALLIPSFVSSRREAPINSTENFARSTAKLAAVRAINAESAASRSRSRARRRQMLLGLGALAVITLGVALYTGSWIWLSISLIVDALLAAYIALLLQVKQQTRTEATLEAEPITQSEVRIVAG